MSTEIGRELVNAIKTGKVVLGSRRTIKLVKTGKAKAVIIAQNAPPDLREEITYYAKLSGIPVYTFPGTSLELGMACGKPFVVASLAILDPGSSKIIDIITEKSSEEVSA